MTTKRPDWAFFDRTEKRFIRKVRSIFRKQRRWIEENSKELSFFQENGIKTMKNSIDDEIAVFLSQIPHKEELADEIVAFMRLAMKRGGKKIVKELKMKSRYGIAFDIKNPKATQFLEQKTLWEYSDALGNIDGTTKKGIQKILVEAHDSGASYTETAKKIQSQGRAGVFSRARGQMIAVREIGVAYEEGRDQVVQEFRQKYPVRQVLKKWQTVNDSRVTATHKTNQAMGWIDYSMLFDGTGDAHAPGSDNPRCRCFTKTKIPAVKK